MLYFYLGWFAAGIIELLIEYVSDISFATYVVPPLPS